ncbi:hypothetical protein HPG69_010601 [Diceros bicornis minor]|uniref:Uncharacterized protein n=1 Tax=Diceros bicornis minor TaxID=77932 RepID=A0A7J7EKC9_DICBM|nr:hypothetical protein HPG69_010601 [Diceros bicornis minor]
MPSFPLAPAPDPQLLQMSCQQNQQQCQLFPKCFPKCPTPKCPLKCPPKRLPQCPAPCPPPVSSCCGPSSGGCCSSGGGGCCLSHHRCGRSQGRRHQSPNCCSSGSVSSLGAPAATALGALAAALGAAADLDHEEH